MNTLRHKTMSGVERPIRHNIGYFEAEVERR